MPKITTKLNKSFGLFGTPLDSLIDLGAAQAYKDFYAYKREETEERLFEASVRTPFAESTIGTKQPFTGATRGVDALYGVDSGAFLEAITGKYKIENGELVVESDLPYFERLEGLFKVKGPFAPEGIFDLTDDDAQILRLIVEDAIERQVEDELN